MLDTNTSHNGSNDRAADYAALTAKIEAGDDECPECTGGWLLDHNKVIACQRCDFTVEGASPEEAALLNANGAAMARQRLAELDAERERAERKEAKKSAPKRPSAQVAAAEDFAAKYRGRFLNVGGVWLTWDESAGVWQADELKGLLEAARAEWPQYSLSWAKQTLEWTASKGLLIRRVSDMDANPNIVACGDGKVLRVDGDKVLVEAARADMYLAKTVGAAPDPDADKMAEWLDMVRTWTGGDKAYMNFLQILSGLALFGRGVKHRLVTFLEGKTESGKSVFTNALLAAFGGYGAACGDIFDVGNNKPQEQKLGELPGLRLAAISDFGGKQQLNSILLKMVSGGDELRGRKLHKDSFAFRAQCWILGASNELPAPDRTDSALKTRLRVLPFEADIDKKDTGLTDRLTRDYLGTMVEWMRRGFETYLQAGETVTWPLAVRQRTDEFYARIDPIQGWMNDCCELGAEIFAPSVALFKSYNEWREGEGFKRLKGNRGFYKELTSRGFAADKRRVNGRMTAGRVGLKLATETVETVPLSQNTFKSASNNTGIKGFRNNTTVSTVSGDETASDPPARTGGLSEDELQAELDGQEAWNAEYAKQTDLFG